MSAINRRYDIDWLRIIAIGLLLLYHTAIGFQPWGIMIGFIATEKTWQSLWIPMALFNTWRIPLLFFVSGMGVYFSMQKRNWKQLIAERTRRILLPFIFGMFFIFPVSTLIWQYYYNLELHYACNPGHLWFLGNIFAYVLLLSPFFYYLKLHESGKAGAWIKLVYGSPWGFLLVVASFMAEAVIVHPIPYEMYSMTWHGFILGLMAFFFGFCFVFSGLRFWEMVLQWRWLYSGFAAALFTVRLFHYELKAPVYIFVPEAACWIFSALGFAFKYLNHPGKILSYLSAAAYPVYIMHMVFLFLGSLILFPVNMPAPLQYILVLLFTLAGSLAFYEYILKRLAVLWPLFGISSKAKTPGADI